MPVAIYEPKGKALEYCERAVNLYRGCSHGCSYCYSPGALRMKRQEFECPKPRKGIIEALIKDAPKHSGHEVLMCFTCDPYSQVNDTHGLTQKAIQILQGGGCKVVILTKGGQRSRVDLELLRPGVDKYGATLTFSDASDSAEWEPWAASPAERMYVLQEAKRKGITTWVSLEPVIDPKQTLDLIDSTADFVDLYKIGKWNHDKRANAIDWKDFAGRAVEKCCGLGVDFILKKDLAAYLPGGES